MLVLAIGFFSVSVFLGMSFYYKYQAHLSVDSLSLRYSRIGDYCGRPIHLRFDYHSEDGQKCEAVEVHVDEVYHYGNDYFLKGYVGDTRRSRVYKRSRITNLTIDARGQELRFLERLFLESSGGGSHAIA